MSSDETSNIPRPSKPTVVVFRGGPHDGAVHTGGPTTNDVMMARFIANIYEDKGTVEVIGNFNFGSPVAHRYKLASADESDALRTLVVDYVSQ
jgi:hypothetical protein